MKVLVTGAAGCIGRATVSRLAARGHAVRAVDQVAGVARSGVEWIAVDLSHIGPGTLLEGCDAVIHLAALVHRPEITDPAAYHRDNVELTIALLQGARRARIAPGRFVLSSTVAVYGRDYDLVADERTPVAPRTPYARSKLEAEHAVLDSGGVVMRFPVAYGPGDRGNVGRLVHAISRGRFVLPGPCGARRSLVASGNAAAAMVRAIEAGAASDVYLVTDDDDRTVRALVEAIAASLTPPARVRTMAYAPVAAVAAIGTGLARLGLSTRVDLDALRKLTTPLVFSCERAKRVFGYAPVIGFESAIRDAVADVSART